MITTKHSKVMLVGGYSDRKREPLDAFLKLEGISSKWIEINVPLKAQRYHHIAIKGTVEVFCGKLNE